MAEFFLVLFSFQFYIYFWTIIIVCSALFPSFRLAREPILLWFSVVQFLIILLLTLTFSLINSVIEKVIVKFFKAKICFGLYRECLF